MHSEQAAPDACSFCKLPAPARSTHVTSRIFPVPARREFASEVRAKAGLPHVLECHHGQVSFAIPCKFPANREARLEGRAKRSHLLPPRFPQGKRQRSHAR